MSTVFEVLYQNKVSVLKEQHSHVCAKWIDPNQTVKGNEGPPLLFLWPSMVQIFIFKTYNFALNVECVDLVNEYQWVEMLNYTYFSCTKAVCVYESVQTICFEGNPWWDLCTCLHSTLGRVLDEVELCCPHRFKAYGGEPVTASSSSVLSLKSQS